MPYNYWDSAYASGHVPWDPGDFDGHLPGLIRRYGVNAGRALDVGCGTGKSLIWLAEHGFRCTGIEIAPTAISQANDLARRRGVECRWLLGSFPEEFGPDQLADSSFDFVMDRGWFHLFRSAGDHGKIVTQIARVLAPGGLWYSLIAARVSGGGYGGPPRWSESEVRRAITPVLSIEDLSLSVFTPGEPDSMPSWICVSRPNSPN